MPVGYTHREVSRWLSRDGVQHLSTTVVARMASRFSSKETAIILGLKSPQKSWQAADPAWRKVACFARYDLARTILTILDHVDQVEPLTDQQRLALGGALGNPITHLNRSSA